MSARLDAIGRMAWGVGLVVYAMLAAGHVGLAELNQDEGLYLYAARLVAEGRRPYADFAFTQGPVFPATYAAVWPLIGRGGILAGRLLTTVLGFLGAVLTAVAAALLVPPALRRPTAAAAWLLMALNSYQIHFTTLVKTYALATLWLGLGCVALALSLRTPPALSRGHLWAFVAGVAMAMAAAVRLSAVAAALVLGVGLAWPSRRAPISRTLAFFAGLVLAGLAAFGPHLAFAREGLIFGLIEYHAGRSTGGLGSWAFYRAGFISRTLLAYWPVVLLAGDRLIKAPTWAAVGSPSVAPSGVVILLAAAAAMTAVHLLAPFPYDDYQVVVYPLVVVAVSAWWMGGAEGLPAQAGDASLPQRGDAAIPARRLAWLMGVGLLAVAMAPVHQTWFILRRDRIWWRLKPEPDLRVLRRVGRRLTEWAPPDRPLLTQDLYLAIEARRRVPRGWELGPFCYFPDMATDRARRLNVMNPETLDETLARTPAVCAAFSGYGLSIASPSITELPGDEQARWQSLVDERFEPVAEIPDFGQAHTTLRIYRRRDAP